MTGSATITVTPQVSGPKPIIATISPQPATALDQITITGTNLTANITGAITAIFSDAVGHPISTQLSASGTSVTTFVPRGAVTGPIYLDAYVPSPQGFMPVQSNMLQFQRLARLRIRTPRQDVAAGESG